MILFRRKKKLLKEKKMAEEKKKVTFEKESAFEEQNRVLTAEGWKRKLLEKRNP